MVKVLALGQQADAHLRYNGGGAAALDGYTHANGAPLPLPSSVGLAMGAAGAPLNGLHNPNPAATYLAAQHSQPPPVFADEGGSLGGYAARGGLAGPAGLGDPGALQPRGSASSGAGAALVGTAFPCAALMQPPALPPDWPATNMVCRASQTAARAQQLAARAWCVIAAGVDSGCRVCT